MRFHQAHATPPARKYSGGSRESRSTLLRAAAKFADAHSPCLQGIESRRRRQCPWNPGHPIPIWGNSPALKVGHDAEQTSLKPPAPSWETQSAYTRAMRFRRSSRILIAWITSAAVMISAIVPAVVQAAAATAGGPWTDLCLSRGSSPKSGETAPVGRLRLACSSCPLHAPPVLAPPLAISAFEQLRVDAVSVQWTSIDVCLGRHWATARSRAPPSL